MPSPFPGMDPYLENRRLWPVFHKAFISALMFDLNAVLPEGFVASQDERVYVAPVERDVFPDVAVVEVGTGAGIPSVVSGTAGTALVEDPPVVLEDAQEEVREPYVTILSAGADQQVVTVIELLSPKNKYRSGNGRATYQAKQRIFRAGVTNLIEIDLLRGGEHTVAAEEERLEAFQPFDYLVSLHRAGAGGRFEVWPLTIQQRLPRIRVPLVADLPDLIFDLQAPFTRTYEGGRFGVRIDYRRDPMPRLAQADRRWTEELLRMAGLRS